MTDPFSNPAPPKVRDRADIDPFGIPSDSGRATRQGDFEDRAPIPRDQWDRYLMRNWDGTAPAPNKGLTRVSTNKSALSNTIGIQKWAGRRIVHGLGRDPQAVEAAMRAAAMEEGRAQEQALGKVADAAYQIGGGKERAGRGTEFHTITEARNRGELDREALDPKWTPDLSAYETLLEQNNIRIKPEYLERVVRCPFNQGGALDNIVEYWNPDTEEWELVVADLKTGRSLDLGWLEILIQLWSYANAEAMWVTTKIIRNDPNDPEKITDVEGYYEQMPRELRTDKALIIHCPLDGTATLYVLDLSGVERYARAAVEARRANAEAKNKVSLISSYRPGAFVTQPDYVGTVTNPPVETRQGVVVVESDAGPAPFSAPIHVPRPAEPTADQQASADLAAARLAKVDAMAKAEGRNDDDDDDDGPTSVTSPPVTVDPVTGRKKRTCGLCHQPGHTRKTCPGPVKTVPDLEPATGRGPLGTETGSAPDASAQAAAPYCLQVDHPVCSWTAEHPDAPGRWVCSISGKPAKQAYEAGTTAVTQDPPAFGHPAPPPWPGPDPAPDMVLWGIKQAGTLEALTAVRDTAIRDQTWVEALHSSPAIARWYELAPGATP